MREAAALPGPEQRQVSGVVLSGAVRWGRAVRCGARRGWREGGGVPRAGRERDVQPHAAPGSRPERAAAAVAAAAGSPEGAGASRSPAAGPGGAGPGRAGHGRPPPLVRAAPRPGAAALPRSPR